METSTESASTSISGRTFRNILNDRGEATLFCVLILVVLSGILTLSGLELQRQFSLLKKRTHLFLCTKEVKGELAHYMKYIGRLNWLIKNTSRAQMVAVFIPPLWPYIGDADKVKKVAKGLQVLELANFNVRLGLLAKRCPIDPQLFLNPYKLGTDYGFERDGNEAALLRKEKWTYYFLEKPYLLTLEVRGEKTERLRPAVDIRAEEKGAMLSSLLSSRY